MQKQHRQEKSENKEIQSNKKGNVRSSELEFTDGNQEELPLTSSEEDYLKSIKELSADSKVTVSEVASHMNRKAPSVTEMVTRLGEKGLLDHKKYRHLSLTEKGKRIAHKVKSKHKTLSKFIKLLGIDEKRAKLDACQMEHFIHDKTLKRLRKFVEFVENFPNEPIWLSHFEDYLKKEDTLSVGANHKKLEKVKKALKTN